MKTYVLVDFENVQPENTDFTQDETVELLIFIGKSQTKLPTDLVLAVKALGNRADYIRMEGSGKNALDFHIACYLGQLTTQAPDAKFFIVSKDTGFDPLIAHLATKGRSVKRVADTRAIRPAAPVATDATASPGSSARVDRAVKQLNALGKARPLTLKKLNNTLQDLLGRDHPLSEDDLRGVVASLQTRGLLTVRDTKITYSV